MRLSKRLHLLLLSFFPVVAFAQAQAPIAPDRPDAAEGAAVVGRGVFQIEAGLATERERGGERSRSTPTMFRLGVSEEVELRLETEGWTSAGKQRGMGDSALSAKWNFLDEDKSGVSMAVIGGVTFPSGAKAFRGEGSRPFLLLATEWELGKEWSLSVMPGLVRDRDDGKSFSTGVLAISLDHGWTEQVHSFVELSSPRLASAEHGGNQLSINVGATYLVSKDWQVDAAVFHGLNQRTAQNFFTVGFSTRF